MGGEFKFGVEEEFQLLDPVTGRLRGRVPAAMTGPDSGRPRRGNDPSTRVSTPPEWFDAGQARAGLAARRRQLLADAAAQGLILAATGVYAGGAEVGDSAGRGEPGASGPSGNGSEAETSGQSEIGTGDLFDMRVRVAVPDRETAVRAMCGAAPYLPLLLAVAGSSPIYRGRDTSFHSFRTVRRDMFPRVGLPLPVASSAEFDRLSQILATAGSTRGRRHPLAWDVQPDRSAAILEFRLFDAQPRLDAVVFLAACARALTALYADRPPAALTGLELQVLRENRWLAARFGTDARFIRPETRSARTWSAAEALTALVDRLGPVAERLGDGHELRRLNEVLDAGSAAAAMREEFRREGSLAAVYRWAAKATAAL